MLDWCDPVSFYPLAALLVDEPLLRVQVEALNEGEGLAWHFDALKNPERLRHAIEVTAPLDDDVGVLGIDPLFATFALRGASTSPVVGVQRYHGSLIFRVSVASMDGSSWKDVWRSSVRLPQ